MTKTINHRQVTVKKWDVDRLSEWKKTVSDEGESSEDPGSRTVL